MSSSVPLRYRTRLQHVRPLRRTLCLRWLSGSSNDALQPLSPEATSMRMDRSSPPGVRVLLTGLAMGESPRWHGGRLWFSDWGAQEIIAVDLDGSSEVQVRTPFGLPFCIDWLPDGRL